MKRIKPQMSLSVLITISTVLLLSMLTWNNSYTSFLGITFDTKTQTLEENAISFAKMNEVMHDKLYSSERSSSRTGNICLNRGRWVSAKYIHANETEDCRLLVKNMLSFKSPKRVTLLGDSTLRFTFYGALNNYNENECTMIKMSKSTADNMQYMELPSRTNVSFIDGLRYAKLHEYQVPGFSGCAQCKHRLFKCQDREIEYLGVEFARDYYMLSPTTNSTQETVALYLKKTSPDLCLVSSGQHDFRLKHLSGKQFINDVNAYINAIKGSCKNTIWLSMNKVKGDKRYPQNNKDILIRNAQVSQIIETYHPSVGFIDMYPMSAPHALHLDNIHLNSTYYQTVASFFVDQSRTVRQERPWFIEGLAFDT